MAPLLLLLQQRTGLEERTHVSSLIPSAETLLPFNLHLDLHLNAEQEGYYLGRTLTERCTFLSRPLCSA